MCERRYTAAVVTELQQITLAVELRKFVAVKVSQWRYAQDDGSYGAGFIDAMQLVEQWLEQRAFDYSRCDNPPE